MEINGSAPAISRAEVEIEAAASIIWDLIADIEGWPSWNPDVKSADLHGPLAVDTEFTWKAGPGTIRSRLQEVDRPAVIGWTGRTMGINAVHVWRFQPRGEGVTVATSEESWEGLPVSLLRRLMQRNLDKGIASGIARLKTEAERRARES